MKERVQLGNQRCSKVIIILTLSGQLMAVLLLASLMPIVQMVVVLMFFGLLLARPLLPQQPHLGRVGAWSIIIPDKNHHASRFYMNFI